MTPVTTTAVDGDLISGYEQMRRCVLGSGDAGSTRTGLAVFQRSGMAGWLRARRATECRTASRPPSNSGLPPRNGEDELIRVLGEMALNAYREMRHAS